jgi:futalosine hydrolase
LSINGVIVSTIPEAELIMESIPDRESFFIQGKRFYKGYLNGAAVVLSVCGIGKANAAHGAALLFERFKPARVYAIGIAGAYPSSGLDIGDIAVADKEIYGDEGLMTEDGILTMDELVLPIASVDCCDYYNEFPLFIPDKLKGHKHIGAFVTVSACTGTLKNGMATCKRFNAICENMEGAAVAHVGLLNNVPVTEIRGVSNIIEDRGVKPLDKAALSLAAQNAQKFFMEMFFPD